MHLIGIFKKNGKKYGRLYEIMNYNKSVDQLNEELTKDIETFKLPEELPKTFKKMMNNGIGKPIIFGE